MGAVATKQGIDLLNTLSKMGATSIQLLKI